VQGALQALRGPSLAALVQDDGGVDEDETIDEFDLVDGYRVVGRQGERLA
jgi:hypothetical protein